MIGYAQPVKIQLIGSKNCLLALTLIPQIDTLSRCLILLKFSLADRSLGKPFVFNFAANQPDLPIGNPWELSFSFPQPVVNNLCWLVRYLPSICLKTGYYASLSKWEARRDFFTS